MTHGEMLELRRWMSDLANAQGETAHRIEQVWKDVQAYHAALLEDSKKCHEELAHVRAELRIIRRSQRAVRKRLQQEKLDAKKRSWLGWASFLGMAFYRGFVIFVGAVVTALGLLKPEHVLGILEGIEKLIKGG